MHPYTPNPMYLFTRAEAGVLVDSFVSADHRKRKSLAIIAAPIDCTNERQYDLAQRHILARVQDAEKIILRATIPTTQKIPHLILPNGNMLEQPGRRGPFRTYFDGSSIDPLTHAIVICVDMTEKTITAQCPKGHELDPKYKKLLDEIFPGCTHKTIRHEQQTDQHSCVPLTLRNVFAHAGIMPAAEKVDITAWRSELLDELRELERFAKKHPQSEVALALAEDRAADNTVYKRMTPIYAKKYAAEF